MTSALNRRSDEGAAVMSSHIIRIHFCVGAGGDFMLALTNSLRQSLFGIRGCRRGTLDQLRNNRLGGGHFSALNRVN